jgi:hypothetical protein
MSLVALFVLSTSFFVIDLPQLARAAEEKPAGTVKTSNIIASAGEANLANGNGDVSPSGLK